MDKPTIGRIVHFRTDKSDKPCAALVVDDDAGDGRIMLQVFANSGGRFHELLPAIEKQNNTQGHWWEWPHRG